MLNGFRSKKEKVTNLRKLNLGINDLFDRDKNCIEKEKKGKN